MTIKTLTVFSAFAVALGVASLSMLPDGFGSAKAAGDRFIVTPIEGGIMRVDRRTGEVSVCQRHNGKWACELVEDNRRSAGRREGLGGFGNNGSDMGPGHKRKSREEARRKRQEPYDDMEEDGFMSPEDVDNAMNTFEGMVDRLMGTAKQIKRRMSEGDNLE